jgi:hypothetical protein
MAYSENNITMKKNRFRLRQVFWLDLHKSDEAQLAETIETLKVQRTFASTIRDGIRLVCDLRAGQLDILLTLFPWVEEAFYQRFTGHESPVIHDQLMRLEQLLLQQAQTPAAGPKALQVPQIAGPRYDDDDIQLTIKKATSDGSSALNFLESAFNLIQ